jgi:hypothetical protein
MHLVSSARRPLTRATLAVQERVHRLVRELIQAGRWRWRAPR